MIIPYWLYKQHQQRQVQGLNQDQLAGDQSELTPKQQRILARSLERTQQGRGHEHFRAAATNKEVER